LEEIHSRDTTVLIDFVGNTIIMIIMMIEIQYSGTAFHVYCIKTMALCPSYINYHLKRGLFVASYVQPVIKQYKPTIV